MKMARSDSGIRVTNVAWLWAALGVPLAIFFTRQSVAHVARGANLRETAIVIAGALFSAGAAMLLTQWSDFRFDENGRAVSWRRGGFLRSSSGTIPFERIRFAVVQFNQMTGDPKGPSDWYRVALQTDDGIVPLTTSYAGGKVSDMRCREIRTAINELLGAKLASEDDNDIRELANSGNRAAAIGFISARRGLDTTAAHAHLAQMSGDSATGKAA